MMKKFFLILFLTFILLLPLTALAIEYKFGGIDDNATPATYIKALFIWGLGIVGALAVAAIAYGGVWYMVGKVEQGKEIIYSALLGLLLLFGSWLILYTINPDLATLKNPTMPAPSPAPSASTAHSSSVIDYSKNKLPGVTPATPGTYTEQAARDYLSMGIGVKDKCPAGQTTGCVNLDGIQGSTLNEVVALSTVVGANNVYITGGTEGCGTVHAAGIGHCTGDKVDLRPNSTLDSYIQSAFLYIGTRSDGAKQYKATDGTIYAKENDHWDVSVPRT